LLIEREDTDFFSSSSPLACSSFAVLILVHKWMPSVLGVVAAVVVGLIVEEN
jgi:hypothetical protein